MARGGACGRPQGSSNMLTVLSSTCLIFAGCALLYQADDRRSAFASVRGSPRLRLGLRAGATLVFILTLVMTASLQGWELGIPIWLGIFSFAFVAGLFLSAQKPEWHAKAAAGFGAVGVILALGALVL
ncbi:MAG: DUF3325 family protein [Pseudomonadota bacterium]